jgi:hypothetical protein
VPPKPIETLPSSSMTGTARRPPDSASISFRRFVSARTLTYSTSNPFLAYASRAFDV